MMKKLLTMFGVVLCGFATTLPVLAEARDEKVSAPTNFYIDIINEDDVILLWEENEDPDLKEYVVLKSIGTDKAPEPFATVPASESSFIDDKVELGRSYTYRVQAKAENGQVAATDPKSIVIQTTITNTPVPDLPVATGPVGGKAKSLLNPDRDDFWTNLIAVNLLLVGGLLLMYMLVRYLLVERQPRRKQTAMPEYPRAKKMQELKLNDKQSEAKQTPQVKLKLKSDHEHPDVVRKAKDRVYAKEKSKIKEWVEAS